MLDSSEIINIISEETSIISQPMDESQLVEQTKLLLSSLEHNEIPPCALNEKFYQGEM